MGRVGRKNKVEIDDVVGIGDVIDKGDIYTVCM